MPVRIGLADEAGLSMHGRVDSVAARFDPNRGTIHCRAVISNADGLLIPGLFARVRLITGPTRKALMVAEDAVVTDQGRTFLFVVGDRDVAELREVKLGAARDGGLRPVKAGVKASEWVVVAGVRGVKAGARVKATQAPMPESPATP